MESKLNIDKISKTKFWVNSKGQLHRENDLPAVEYISGNKAWYINGNLHRENGPAIIDKVFKSELWYLNDIRYYIPEEMPLNLYIAYCKWQLKEKPKRNFFKDILMSLYDLFGRIL